MASLNFDATQVKPAESRDYSVLPAGLYTAEITNADVKPLKSGNGTGLNLEFTIIDPAPYTKRKVWQSLNIEHTSAEAEKIGKSQLSALCHAVGILKVTDSDELFQRIVRIRTKVRKQEGYDPRPEVTGYEPAGAPLPAANAPTASQPAASGTAVPPWKKRAA